LTHYFVGADIGTSSCKVSVFDAGYQVLALTSVGYDIVSPHSGWAELDPEAVWLALCQTVRSALIGLKGDLSSSAFYMSFSVLGNAVIPVDPNGKMLYPAILSSDVRSIKYVNRIKEELGSEYLASITGRTIHPSNVLPRILWLQENLPEINEEVVFHDLQSWLFTKLGAGAITDHTMASSTLLYSLKQKKWSPELLNYANLKVNNLPEIRQAGTQVRLLKEPIWDELGFPKQSKVELFMGGMDQECNALGSGMVHQGDAVCSWGTVLVIDTTIDSSLKIESLTKEGMYKGIGLIPGQFVTHAFILNGGGSMRWFCNNFCGKEQLEAKNANINIYDYIFNEKLKEENVFFLPHLAGSGTPWMDPESRGLFLGLTLKSNPRSLANAVLEGIMFELKENINKFKEIGIKIDNLKVTGGGAKSDKWLQTMANILNIKVIRLSFSEGGGLGAAILAGYGAGVFKDLTSASKKCAVTQDVFEPVKGVNYDEKFKVYHAIYPMMRKLNHMIAELGQM
jgi:xylulokinase